jgi:ribosomal-protein-alanine N-acetyltransferase
MVCGKNVHIEELKFDSENRDNLIEKIGELEAEIFSPAWSVRMIEETLSSEYNHILVATEDDQGAGYIMYSAPCEDADILRVAVSCRYRRQNIGRKLMDKMENLCREKSVENIFLEVRASNLPAISLYQKCGYEEIAVRKNYYSSPVEHGLVMQRSLKYE